MPVKVNDIKHKKDLGQYFTISDDLQKFVFENTKHKSSCLLEPSFGAGHLLKKFKEYDARLKASYSTLPENPNLLHKGRIR